MGKLLSGRLVENTKLGQLLVSENTYNNTVLLTTDFHTDINERKAREAVEAAAKDIFYGTIGDIRMEDHAVDGEPGIRVVYITDINAVFMSDVEDFKRKVKNEVGNSNFGKITIVSV